MPIEVRELVVRANIASRQQGANAPASGADKDKKITTIQEAVDQFLEIQKMKKER